ncbi:MAG: hypothetical protein H0U87_00415 [Acidobacteria bacterium]|nr:hypothetical protein [Acidobacteriota bacterium]
MKDVLFALLALVSAALAAYFLYKFQHYDDSTSMLIGIVFALAAVILGGLFIFGRLTRHEDIHVTE